MKKSMEARLIELSIDIIMKKFEKEGRVRTDMFNRIDPTEHKEATGTFWMEHGVMSEDGSPEEYYLILHDTPWGTEITLSQDGSIFYWVYYDHQDRVLVARPKNRTFSEDLTIPLEAMAKDLIVGQMPEDVNLDEPFMGFIA